MAQYLLFIIKRYIKVHYVIFFNSLPRFLKSEVKSRVLRQRLYRYCADMALIADVRHLPNVSIDYSSIIFNGYNLL